MADVDSVVYTTTERKVRKVKKTTKRRESHDQNASEVTITEVDNTQSNHHAIEEYVLADNPADPHSLIIISSFFLVLTTTRNVVVVIIVVLTIRTSGILRASPRKLCTRDRKHCDSMVIVAHIMWTFEGWLHQI